MTCSARSFFAVVALSAMAACGTVKDVKEVNDATLRVADADTANWLTYGRTYSEQRHSPLRQVNDTSVARLGLAFSVDMRTLHGLEATPLVKNAAATTMNTVFIISPYSPLVGPAGIAVRKRVITCPFRMLPSISSRSCAAAPGES